MKNAMTRWDEEDEEERIPTVADPCWVELAAPVLAFFSRPRDWDSIHAWASSQKMNATILRHCVAWLEDRGLARSFITETKIQWVATNARYTVELITETLVDKQG